MLLAFQQAAPPFVGPSCERGVAGQHGSAPRYKAFPFSPQPVVHLYRGSPPYQDVSGRYLTGAARFTFDAGAAYRRGVAAEKVVHSGFSTAATALAGNAG